MIRTYKDYAYILTSSTNIKITFDIICHALEKLDHLEQPTIIPLPPPPTPYPQPPPPIPYPQPPTPYPLPPTPYPLPPTPYPFTPYPHTLYPPTP